MRSGKEGRRGKATMTVRVEAGLDRKFYLDLLCNLLVAVYLPCCTVA